MEGGRLVPVEGTCSYGWVGRRSSGGQEGRWVVRRDGLGGCLNCDLGGFRGLTVIAGLGRGRESVLLTLAGDGCGEQVNVGGGGGGSVKWRASLSILVRSAGRR